jgi:hypothetical protein
MDLPESKVLIPPFDFWFLIRSSDSETDPANL